MENNKTEVVENPQSTNNNDMYDEDQDCQDNNNYDVYMDDQFFHYSSYDQNNEKLNQLYN